MTSNIGAIGFLALSLVAAAPVAPPSQVFVLAHDLAALQHWKQNIDAYLVIRGQAAQVTPPQIPTSAAELVRAQLTFAAEIRARRQNAKVGDLFTPDVQRTFRKMIAQTLSDHEIAAAELVDEFLADIQPGGTWPAVNQRFSWQLGTAMPGCLLDALPKLPKGLQYRLVAHDLILLDTDANLVVDILPEALPRPTRQ
jgi:hypothetical protein